MDQSCQGKQSTKTSSPAEVPPPFSPDGKPIDTMEPLPREPFNPRMHFAFMTIIKISGMLFSNQLGQFPITSNRGNKYVVIFYTTHDANFVKSVPIKSRSKEELLRAYRLVYAHLSAWASNCNFKRWITRCLTMLKPSFVKRTHASSTPHLTTTAPIR